ncbi:hypothetical protein DFR70_110170 [Nocardia tenerifensis]|uniref:Uncharacterized protein n=1 Tax=Nocardia tenerifensis TaxID=228006 RepID=A0A318JWC3_9NOCA|nr:hypothetical protein DFR70_110170 [Nocardia tenerifensis]
MAHVHAVVLGPLVVLTVLVPLRGGQVPELAVGQQFGKAREPARL